jgi:hypothetical protein
MSRVLPIVVIGAALGTGIVVLILSGVLGGAYWNLFVILPMIAMPVPWVLFGQNSFDNSGGGWKAFGEFLSGFLFSTSWAIIGIAYHLGAVSFFPIVC